MKRECPMPARVFPLSISILFVASCGAMNSAQLAGGGGVHTRRTRGTMPWNNAVRTRGVFTHRDDFLKPACAERGLVRTGPNPDAKTGTPKLGGTKLESQVWCARLSGQDPS